MPRVPPPLECHPVCVLHTSHCRADHCRVREGEGEKGREGTGTGRGTGRGRGRWGGGRGGQGGGEGGREGGRKSKGENGKGLGGRREEATNKE